MGSKATALAALLEGAPSDWLTRNSTGERLLSTILAQCYESGLSATPAGADDVTNLHAILDVALQEGCGEVVVDWVVEVCSDPAAASADPVEAHLMDGRCAQQWARRALSTCQARLLQALQLGLTADAAPAVLSAEAGRLHTLLHILQALAASGGQADLEQAQRLAAAAAVAVWAQQVLLVGRQQWGGAYSSEAEWRLAVNRQRDAAAPGMLLIHHLLHTLRAAGCEPPSYPFASLERALDLFLTGPPNGDCARTKLAAFIYALTDAGFDISDDSFRELGAEAEQVSAWRGACWADQALRGEEGAASLEAACRVLPGGAARHLGFRAVAALEAVGAPDVALAAARCGAGAPSERLLEQQALARARLDCGLLTEAVVQATRFLESLAPGSGGRAEAAEALGVQLAEWAAEAQQLPSLAQLPLAPALEGALLRWLRVAASEGGAAPSHLPLFLLQRGHLREAVQASAAIEEALVTGSLQEEEHITAQRRTSIAAAKLLLPLPASPLSSVHMAPLHSNPGFPATDGLGGSGGGVVGTPTLNMETSNMTAASPEATPMDDDGRGEARTEGATQAAGGSASKAARPVRQQDFDAAMGLAVTPPFAGPRTRQTAKRQRLQGLRS